MKITFVHIQFKVITTWKTLAPESWVGKWPIREDVQSIGCLFVTCWNGRNFSNVVEVFITEAPNDKFRLISVRWKVVRLRFSASIKECTRNMGNVLGQQMRISILILGFKGLISFLCSKQDEERGKEDQESKPENEEAGKADGTAD